MDIENTIKAREAKLVLKYEIVPWVGFFRSGEIEAPKTFKFPIKV